MDIQHSDGAAAALRIAWAWFWVGVSQLGPVQVVQMVGGIVATIYTAAQLYVLVRDKIAPRRIRRGQA